MNDLISSLSALASKKEKIILGLMSGTSMDGLDLALCRITGKGRDTGIEVLAFSTQPYPEKLKQQLKDIISVPACSLEDLCLMHTRLGRFTAGQIQKQLQAWDVDSATVDCIASHGQTLYHAPQSKHGREGEPHSTLQIGEADHIARQTGILTISDFRQKHTAAGGEGAPMVALIDQMLFGNPTTDRLLLNIGGIANFTYLPADSSAAAYITGDTGPGNTLLDAAAHRHRGQPFDAGGATARKGTVDQPLLKALKDNSFFDLGFPKTTGPELFNWSYVQRAQKVAGAAEMSPQDMLATLTEFTADTIVEAIQKVHPSGALEVLISGGGLHNTFLMERLEQQLPESTFVSFSEAYFEADAKEAVCFAVLANETLSGEGFVVPGANKQEKIHFGKISFPG